MAKQEQTVRVEVSAGGLYQREMAIGQGRANFASEERGNSEGRVGWADREGDPLGERSLSSLLLSISCVT